MNVIAGAAVGVTEGASGTAIVTIDEPIIVSITTNTTAAVGIALSVGVASAGAATICRAIAWGGIGADRAAGSLITYKTATWGDGAATI